MEEESSWTSEFEDVGRDNHRFGSLSETNFEGNEEANKVSVDVILPDDMLERIIAYLPIASIFRASSVCKRWHDIVRSRRFIWNYSCVVSQRPWYYMFTSSDEPMGYAFDQIFQKWYAINLPCIKSSHWYSASSHGLVCFMNNEDRNELFVCNPITKRSRKLEKPPPGPICPDYSALAISVDWISHLYTVCLLRCKQVPGSFLHSDLSIHAYNSETKTWTTSWTEVLTGWRTGDESVICNGVLYVLTYATSENRQGLLTYNLSSRHPHGSLLENFISVPCPLTCGRLMNLKEQLVMVGGIGRRDRSDIIRGIGIWLLKGREWQEIARMPQKFFQGFGEFDEFFASSGAEDLIYIHCYGAPALLLFNMNQKRWKWSQKCPVTKRFPSHFFTGFCFEPRIDISP